MGTARGIMPQMVIWLRQISSLISQALLKLLSINLFYVSLFGAAAVDLHFAGRGRSTFTGWLKLQIISMSAWTGCSDVPKRWN